MKDCRASLRVLAPRFCRRRFPALVLAGSVAALGTTGCHRTSGSPASVDGGLAAVSSSSEGRDGSAFDPDGSADAGDGHFQGTIELVVEDMTDAPTSRPDELPPSERYTFSVKGDAYRWDLFERNTPRGDYRIYDRSAHRFYTVMQSQSVVFATPESSLLVADPTAAFVLEDLHTKGHVALNECDRYSTTSATARFEICATDKFVSFPFQMLPGTVRTLVPFGGELQSRKLFPLLVNHYDLTDAGAPETTSTKPKKKILHVRPSFSFRVVNIEAKPIDPVLFDIPKYPIQHIDLLQAGPKKMR